MTLRNGTIFNDLLLGGTGNDQLFGLAGNDILLAGAGNDQLDGGEGDDLLYGEAGNDTLIGSKGNDQFVGGIGTNTADYSSLGQAITLKPFGVVEKAGGFGTDSLISIQRIIASNLLNDTIDSSTTVSPSTGITADLVRNTLTVKGSGSPFPLNLQVFNFENVIGTSFSDTLTGNSANNQLIGNGGDDTINGGDGSDVIEGGAGSDFLNGGSGNDSLTGGDGSDIFTGSSGNDTFNGGNFGDADVADYSALGKVITLKPSGLVEKAGGFGTDNLINIESITASTLLGDTIDASTASGASINVDLNNNTLNVSSPSFTSVFTVRNFENVQGTNSNDTLTGNSGNNVLVGNEGNDILTGGAGNDSLIGGAGDDILTGGVGTDILTGNAGADKFVFNSLAERTDQISDFTVNSDLIQVSRVGFGASSLNQFTYNTSTGNLSFGATAFVTLLNKPLNFNVASSVQFV